MTEINLPEDIIDRFTAQAQQEYPYECCGFLLGSSDGHSVDVSEYIILNNVQKENRERRFLIQPEEFLRIEMEADKKGMSVVGVVHSHPDHPEKPSKFDREHAWPGLSYIIVSVQNGTAEKYRSWRLSDDRNEYSEEKIVIKASNRVTK
jgi:proteasome lid subunit RPN8/RPN11